MASTTVENYLKTIYKMEQKNPDQLVSNGALSDEMNVSPGTATSMIKTLSDAGLVDYQSRNGCKLTPGGEQLALHVLRRHRLIEVFLVKTLSYDWSEVHEEAEQLEHVISDKLLDRIDKFLGRPRFDPHGDPIPSADGEIEPRILKSLANCMAGVSAKIARIMDQNPEFLQFVDSKGLVPGNEILIESNNKVADAIEIKLGDLSLTVSGSVAEKILVETN
ncbi:MAG: metal-dependent transcriptional regulator [Lentisphaeria bacterium]|nr:metal-dependent transcriptional regulator [Lentisphaeria bacterium]NQZ68917.1 metal-dependent transcriptional regulator [Lentisphaeria bacterium]